MLKSIAAQLAIITLTGAVATSALVVPAIAQAAPAAPDQEVALLRLEIKQLEAIKKERSRAVRLEKLQARKAKLEAAIAAATPTAPATPDK